MISLRDVVTGFGNRDPLAEVWRRSLRGGGGGSAEITGTLPLRYIGNGKPLTDYMIYGNTVQNGAPSPEAPVDVVVCGERTKNLLDNQMPAEVNLRGVKYTKNADGSVKVFGTASSQVSYCILMGDGAATNDLNAYTTPIFKAGDTKKFVFSGLSAKIRYTDGTYESNVSGSVTLTKDVGLIYIQVINRSINTTVYPMITLSTERNTGYEPYGYKLPLTVNGTEYPIYLGQVESTRRIKKIVLTGEESGWTDTTVGANHFYLSPALYNGAYMNIGVFSTHYIPSNVPGFDRPNSSIRQVQVGTKASQLSIRDDACETLTDFKTFIQQQYAAGTPVTVWYVLAEPETGIVNEPLMKIGDYADTISFTQAGVAIPTVNGANVLDMTSPVKPSEVYINGKGIKPTGYGQLVDKNGVRILDKNDVRILVHGQ